MNAKIVVDYLRRVNEEMGKTIIMVTHDPAVARVADRILRIEDGVIKAEAPPIGEEVTGPASYAEMLRGRITEVKAQLRRLEDEFREGRISGDEYAERREKLKRTMEVLEEELHRLGIVH